MHVMGWLVRRSCCLSARALQNMTTSSLSCMTAARGKQTAPALPSVAKQSIVRLSAAACTPRSLTIAKSTPRVAVATSSFLIATARSLASMGGAPAVVSRLSTSPRRACDHVGQQHALYLKIERGQSATCTGSGGATSTVIVQVLWFIRIIQVMLQRAGALLSCRGPRLVADTGHMLKGVLLVSSLLPQLLLPLFLCLRVLRPSVLVFSSHCTLAIMLCLQLAGWPGPRNRIWLWCP